MDDIRFHVTDELLRRKKWILNTNFVDLNTRIGQDILKFT